MAKFRKTALIEAEQFDPEKKPWPEGVEQRPDGDERRWEGWQVQTLEGPLRIYPGGWVATGVNGEHYPITDEIFRKTYEKVEDGT